MCKDYASEILIHIIEFKSFVQLKLSHKSDVENYPGHFFTMFLGLTVVHFILLQYI